MQVLIDKYEVFFQNVDFETFGRLVLSPQNRQPTTPRTTFLNSYTGHVLQECNEVNGGTFFPLVLNIGFLLLLPRVNIFFVKHSDIQICQHILPII